jgi:integral membrane protein
MGAVHGVLFILYVVFWADAWNRAKWPLKTAALYFVLSVLPTGGFFAERKLRREAEDAVVAARARKEEAVEA